MNVGSRRYMTCGRCIKDDGHDADDARLSVCPWRTFDSTVNQWLIRPIGSC